MVLFCWGKLDLCRESSPTCQPCTAVSLLRWLKSWNWFGGKFSFVRPFEGNGHRARMAGGDLPRSPLASLRCLSRAYCLAPSHLGLEDVFRIKVPQKRILNFVWWAVEGRDKSADVHMCHTWTKLKREPMLGGCLSVSVVWVGELAVWAVAVML